MAAFSQYIIYADESGSPVLGADAKDYPIFVLNFLVVEKRVYTQHVVPNIQALKFSFFGHDQVVFHEKDIVKQRGDFAFLRGEKKRRDRFMNSLTSVVASRDFAFDYAIVDKSKMQRLSQEAWSPYDIALGICMEQAASRIKKNGETGTIVHVIFEARGRTEDLVLERDFRRVAAGFAKVSFSHSSVREFEWVPVFADKKTNSTGLQIADLAARPLGLSYLRPHQNNRAFAAMRITSAENGGKIYP